MISFIYLMWNSIIFDLLLLKKKYEFMIDINYSWSLNWLLAWEVKSDLESIRFSTKDFIARQGYYISELIGNLPLEGWLLLLLC